MKIYTKILTNDKFYLSFSFMLLFLIPWSHAKANWWIAIESGAVFLQDPDNTTVTPMPGVNLPDNYVNTGLENSAIIGAGLGYEFKRDNQNLWFPSNRLGFFYDYYFPSNVSGYIEKYQAITAYNYSMKINSNTLWLDDQIDLFKWRNIVPFIEVGLGIAWNKAGNYDEEPVPLNPTQDHREIDDGFSTHTQTRFAWRAGVGINVILPCSCDQWNFSILYRYADLGHAKTGTSTNPIDNKGIETKIRSNEVLGMLRYNF